MKYGFRDNSIKTKRLIVQGKMPITYIIPKTVAESTAAILSNHDFNATGTAAVSNTGILAQPPYPICVKVTANSAGTADASDSLTFVGQNAKGEAISEAITISSTAAGNNSSSNAFTNITSITPNSTGKSTSVAVGFGKTIGLPWEIEKDADILSYNYDASYSTANYGTTIVIDSTYDTVVMPAMAAGKVFSITYKTKVQRLRDN